MEKNNLKIYITVLIILIIVLIMSVVFLDTPHFYKSVRRFLITHSYRILTVNDIATIRPWMTFDYVNQAFKLPQDYLKNTLAISDSRYPNMSLGSYAAKEKLHGGQIVIKVQQALYAYLTAKK